MTVQGCRESGTGSGRGGTLGAVGVTGRRGREEAAGEGSRVQTGEHLSELHPVMRDAFRLFLSLFRRCKGHYAQFR